jgi:hypothetical protein
VPDDGSISVLLDMKLAIDEAANNIAFTRSCEIEYYPDGTNCDKLSTCSKCRDEKTTLNSRDETVCGEGFCLAAGSACGPDTCNKCCNKFDQGSNEGNPKSNGSVCGECIADSVICGNVPINVDDGTFKSSCDFCCSGNSLELNKNQGVCGNPTKLERITLDPIEVRPEPIFECSDIPENKCLERINDADGTCTEAVVIQCDDDDDMTIDACDPATGCVFYPFDPPEDNDDDDRLLQEESDDPLYPEGLFFYKEAPPSDVLTDEQTTAIMNWIAAEVVQYIIPFCWKRSTGRGWGEPLSECADHLDRIGLLCYTKCPEGYARVRFDCHQKCPDETGWHNDGLFCRRAEFGQGAGYPWKFGDPLSNSNMYQRCEGDYGGGL